MEGRGLQTNETDKKRHPLRCGGLTYGAIQILRDVEGTNTMASQNLQNHYPSSQAPHDIFTPGYKYHGISKC